MDQATNRQISETSRKGAVRIDIRDLPVSVLTKIILMLYCDDNNRYCVCDVLYKEEAFNLFLADPRLYFKVMRSLIMRKTAQWAFESNYQRLIDEYESQRFRY